MRTLITGGSGFIGTELTRALLDAGDEVIVLDVVPPKLEHPRLRFCEGSVVDDVPSLFSLIRQVDRVVHLASHVGIWHYIDEAEETVSIILDGTRNVLTCLRTVPRPLLLASTSEAYGKGIVYPMREGGDARFGPSEATRWVYGQAKALAESLALAASRRDGLDVKIVRPFNVVGPGQHEDSGLIFPSFAKRVRDGLPLLVHGDGSQTRTYCHVRDLVRGMVRLLEEPTASGKVVNLGGPEEVTVREIAETFVRRAGEVFGLSASWEAVPYTEVYPEGFEDISRRVPDLSRAEYLIGWKVRELIPVEAIIDETLQAVLSPTTVSG